VLNRPGKYFTANLAEAGKKAVFWKSVPEAGIVKINALEQLQKELTQNFSNYNDSSSESYQDSFFREVHLNPKWGQIIITCNLTILIVSLFSLFLFCHTILVRLNCDLYMHFLASNREIIAGGVVV